MNTAKPNLQRILSQLEQEKLIESGWQEKAQAVIRSAADVQPWYVRALVGFSAWLGSWLLIGFFLGAGIVESDTAMLGLGIFFVLGTTLARPLSEHDFMTQLTLAVSLAGEGLITGGTMHMMDEFVAGMFVFIGMEALLIIFFRDHAHRFLSAMGIVFALAGLIYYWEAQIWLHGLAIGTAVIWITLVLRESKMIKRGLGDIVVPAGYGVLTGLLGVLMLSAVYIVPELNRHFVFYPSPWISTLGLGALLLLVVQHLMSAGKTGADTGFRVAIFVFLPLLIIATLPAPGLVMSLIILLLGFSRANRILMGTAIGFFVFFLSAYFYGIEITLLMKSGILIGTGLILLAGKYGLQYLLRVSREAA